MSTADIFGDEDSSDESEVEKETKPSKDVETKDADEEKKPDPFDSDDSAGKQGAKETKKDDKKAEKDPFAEEDSDDDDDAKKTNDKKEDNDSDDDHDVGKKSPKKEEAKKAAAADDDLEDSDDDEPEFDDTDAVTGTSHSKGFQKKASRKSALDTLREQEEAEEAAARADSAQAEAPPKPPPPKVDPRTMVVLEPERPSSSTTLHITKLPNLIGIQPEAFDPATYSAKAEEEEYKGFVHDMIRWRYKKDKDGNIMRDEEGNLMRESNARLVQWEDGSYTLHVGKEALVVDSIDSSQKIGPVDVVTGRTATFAGLNGYLYLSQVANLREPKKDDDEEGEGNFKETAAGTVLECMGAVGSRMTARPSSLRSEAHKSLTVAVRKKTIKRAQIAEIVTQHDPEKMKEERIKQQDGINKEKARKKSNSDSYRSRRPRPGMNREYLEDDYDFDSTNLKAIKKRTMNAEEDDYGDEFIDYGDEDEDDDEGTFNRKRPSKRQRAKNRLDDSDDEEEAPAKSGGGKQAEPDPEEDGGDEDEDEDDDEVVTPVKSSKKRAQAVFDDDDSD